MEVKEWNALLKAVQEVQDGFEPGAVFIGGVAVYAHTLESERYSGFTEFSHDADFMISISDYTDLKDIEQITPNRRLRKAQFYKSGFEFDVYVEGQNDLPVPYPEVAAQSVVRSGIRVASLEHLLVLKLKAFQDRRGSAKGDKDENDLMKLLVMISERRPSSDAAACLDDEMAELIPAVLLSGAALRMSGGNMHTASSLKKAATEAAASLEASRKAAAKMVW